MKLHYCIISNNIPNNSLNINCIIFTSLDELRHFINANYNIYLSDYALLKFDVEYDDYYYYYLQNDLEDSECKYEYEDHIDTYFINYPHTNVDKNQYIDDLISKLNSNNKLFSFNRLLNEDQSKLCIYVTLDNKKIDYKNSSVVLTKTEKLALSKI